MLELRVLGRLDLRDSRGREVRSVLVRPKCLALLIYLAAARPHGFHRRDALVALFWPELDHIRARAALRQAVHTLRKGLGRRVLVSRGREDVAVSGRHLWCDAVAFDLALAADRPDEALALYSGEFAPALHIRGAPGLERWLEKERERLGREATGAAAQLVGQHEELGDLEGAIRWTQRLLELSPFDEDAVARLIDLLARAGDRVRAWSEYEAFAHRLAQEFDDEPSPRLRALIEEVRSYEDGVVMDGITVSHASETPSDGQGVTTEVLAHQLAVLPFTHHGPEDSAYLAAAMPHVISADLRGSRLRPIEPRLVEERARVNDRISGVEVGREIAAHLGAHYFVLGQVIEAGGSVRAMATLFDAGGSLRGSADARVDDESQLFELSAALARDLLAEHWGARSDLSATARYGTRSIAALREFYVGELHYRAARLQRATDAFLRSTAADPEFVIAWIRLAVAASWSFQTDVATHAIAEASRRCDPSREADERLLSALLTMLEGDAPVAEQCLRTFLQEYPDNPEGWMGLGVLQLTMNPLRGRSVLEARDAFERVAALAPHQLQSLVPLAYLAMRDARHADHQQLVQRLGPDHDFAGLMRVVSTFFTRDETDEATVLEALRSAPDVVIHEAARYTAHLAANLDGAAQIAELLTEPGRSPQVRATGHVVLAHLELARERQQAAYARLDATEQCDPEAAILYRALFAVLPFLPADRGRLQSIRDALERSRPDRTLGMPPGPRGPFALHDDIQPQVRGYLRGLVCARLRDKDAALSCAEALEQDTRCQPPGPLVRDLGRGVRSYVAQEQGRTELALSILEASEPKRPLRDMLFQSPFYSNFLERYRRGVLLHQMGRHSEALGWLDMITESSIYGQIYAKPSERILSGFVPPTNDR